jgi:hypothetical protein
MEVPRQLTSPIFLVDRVERSVSTWADALPHTDE